MSYILGQEKPSLDDALAHHGVLGMKWGHHKAAPTGGSAPASAPAPTNRQLNKASRQKDKASRNAEIDAARQRYNTTARTNYVKAKDQFKADKKTIGTREARKKFNEVKQKNVDDFEIANQAKSGRETTVAILGVVGLVAVSSILKAAASR
jgi:hypothetical protein